MNEQQFDTLVVGAGQAGLAVSYWLTQQGRNHAILEKNRVGEAWRTGRWDSFTLVTPSWTLQLPGFPYKGEPNGFLTREEVVRYLDNYVALFNPPVRTGIEVMCIEAAGDGFDVQTNQGTLNASNVVIATGAFQKPRIPAFSSKIAAHIHQIHSAEYRNPDALPPGAVLVVGSGQSGCQIAEELYRQGRKVYLSTGRCGRVPRRYRGKDIFEWAQAIGAFGRIVDKLSSPEERFEANPQLSGNGGGHSLNLHQFALDGVTLLGRLIGADETRVYLAPDLKDNLAAADKVAAEFQQGIDKFIQANGINATDEREPELRAGYDVPVTTELNLEAAGITSIIWATGYSFDFNWIRFPIFDEFGYPLQQRGVTPQPGLYFIGLQWLHTGASSLFLGVGEDAAHIASHIASRSKQGVP